MGLILDLAVAALALAVIGSLGLLAWTLAVNAVRATQETRTRTAAARARAADAEARVRSAAASATATLERVRRRTDRYGPGDQSDR